LIGQGLKELVLKNVIIRPPMPEVGIVGQKKKKKKRVKRDTRRKKGGWGEAKEPGMVKESRLSHRFFLNCDEPNGNVR